MDWITRLIDLIPWTQEASKSWRHRTSILKSVAEYGVQSGVKLSILSQNWEHLLDVMVNKAHVQIRDEATYKRIRLAQLSRLWGTSHFKIKNFFFHLATRDPVGLEQPATHQLTWLSTFSDLVHHRGLGPSAGAGTDMEPAVLSCSLRPTWQFWPLHPAVNKISKLSSGFCMIQTGKDSQSFVI